MSTAMHDVVDPATEHVIRSVPSTSADEADHAIDAAHAAFQSWRAVAPADRGRLLRRFAELVDGCEQVLVTAAVAEDVPETLTGARVDVISGEVRRVR